MRYDTEVQILLDVKGVINTIGSFKVDAHSVRPIFIPIHSHNTAGHCVLSFRSKSKELENLFKLKVTVKVNLNAFTIESLINSFFGFRTTIREIFISILNF